MPQELDETGDYYYRTRYYDPEVGRFISEDAIGLAGGNVNYYVYLGDRPVNSVDPLGLTWTSNWNFFWDWALGRGSNNRYYGPNDVETQEMMNSQGVQDLRNRFFRGKCKSIRRGAYGTYEAYWDTSVNPFTADWSSTAAQVGGFAGASVIDNGDGTATYTIVNVAGTHSFFLHAVPNRSSSTGPMRSIRQTFQWTESIGNCGCK
jgi:RHS repeat-associated protein